MKSTGIVRPVDGLGRVVIPKELRKVKDIKKKDGMEIFTEGEDIILRKYNPCCVFCGDGNDIFEHEGKRICKKCADSIGVKGGA